MVSWGSLGPSESKVSLRYSRYWLEFNATRDWFVIYDLCRKAVDGDGRDAKIRLSFSLSAAAYNGSDIIPFVMVFALDKRCRDLDPPPDRSYMLSDGLAPELTRLANVVSQSALPMHLTPVRSLQAKQKRKKTQYNATISRESSRVAGLLLRQWPSYQSVDLPGEWFDKSCFNTCIKPYIQSISRNIRLKEHVEQLQGVLQKYSLTFPTAPNTPYTFSPRFITKQSKAPSYSLPHVLLSRTNTPTVSADWEPFQDLITPRTATTEDNPVAPQAGPDSLKILVDELRNSQQPLQKLYGNELNKSHRALLRQIVSQPVRDAIPSHELLLLYHNECSFKKDNIISDISAALAPSQNVEKTNDVAGLWPRITPRSLLRHLARDRISKLPDRWRSLIMHYATSLLKYRHSLRLLELSSGQKHEELLLEIEAIRNNVLVESTPDWLLIQVRPLFCS